MTWTHSSLCRWMAIQKKERGREKERPMKGETTLPRDARPHAHTHTHTHKSGPEEVRLPPVRMCMGLGPDACRQTMVTREAAGRKSGGRAAPITKQHAYDLSLSSLFFCPSICRSDTLSLYCSSSLFPSDPFLLRVFGPPICPRLLFISPHVSVPLLCPAL